MVLTRTIEAQARIRLPQKLLQKSFEQKLNGTDFTFYAVPIPDCLLLITAGHEKFDELTSLSSGGGNSISGSSELEDDSEYRKRLSSDSIWTVTAAYETKEARYALYLGIAAIHLGLIPAVGSKASVRLLPYSVEIWHPVKWVAAATKVNAELLGYTAI